MGRKNLLLTSIEKGLRRDHGKFVSDGGKSCWAEFAPQHVPGVFGTDYTYPTHTEIDYYASKGLDVVRLPFLWERLQRTELGPLDARSLADLTTL